MASLPDVSHIQTNHAALISSMNTFYRTLLDLDYLREDEVQIPPHVGDGKTPIATTAIHSALLTPEVQAVLRCLPYVTGAGAGLMEGESTITLHSQPVSYLYKGADAFDRGERLFGYAEGGDEVLLPPWAVLLFSGANRDHRMVIYDTRRSMVYRIVRFLPHCPIPDAQQLNSDTFFFWQGRWLSSTCTRQPHKNSKQPPRP